MIKRIEEIKRCLSNELYEAALALTLTLPDICGQIEYPNSRVGERYTKWLTNNIDMAELGDDPAYPTIMQQFDNSLTTDNYPRLIVDNIYRLRCFFLHSGNVEIDSDFLQEFWLMKPHSMGNVSEEKTIKWQIVHQTNENNEAINRLEIDVKHLCLMICSAAENYYNSKTPEDFSNHTMEIR